MCCTEAQTVLLGKENRHIICIILYSITYAEYFIRNIRGIRAFICLFSQMFLSLDLSAAGKQNHNRPQWAAHNLQAHPTNKDSIKRLSQTSQWNAGIRPGPVRPPVPRLSKEGLRASQRSHRSTPSKPLFTFNTSLK